MSAPNQFKIVIGNKIPRDETHLYTKQNLDAISLASRTLDGGGFKLWMYLSKNVEGYAFDLSPADVTQWTGISGSTYKRAKSDLIEQGYLTEISGKRYLFTEFPHSSAVEDPDAVSALIRSF